MYPQIFQDQKFSVPEIEVLGKPQALYIQMSLREIKSLIIVDCHWNVTVGVDIQLRKVILDIACAEEWDEKPRNLKTNDILP
jgi:hypothetical protein